MLESLYEFYNLIGLSEQDCGCSIINSGQLVPCEDNPEYKCETCPHNLGNNPYPEFTEEKQLKLLRFLSRYCDITVSTTFHYKEQKVYITISNMEFWHIFECDTFEEVLIKATIHLIDMNEVEVEKLEIY